MLKRGQNTKEEQEGPDRWWAGAKWKVMLRVSHCR